MKFYEEVKCPMNYRWNEWNLYSGHMKKHKPKFHRPNKLYLNIVCVLRLVPGFQIRDIATFLVLYF